MIEPGNYISFGDKLWYSGLLQEVKKSGTTLQCLYEALTNSIEAIGLRTDRSNNGKITIKLFSTNTTISDAFHLVKIEIEDDGIGFDDTNFSRLIMYKDNRKGPMNKGSGRIQLVHSFERAKYESVFKDGAGFKKRTFILSKAKPFIDANALIYYDGLSESDAKTPLTTLTLSEPIGDLKEKAFYDNLTVQTLKNEIVRHYILYFCSHIHVLPNITIQHYVENSLYHSESIESKDIPPIEKQDTFNVHYSELAPDGKSMSKTADMESFTLRAFKIDSARLDKNAVKFTSKDEIVENVKLNLELLHPDDTIDGNRMLFLLSSNFIDNRDSDVRGNIRIATVQDFKKGNSIFESKEILIEDIQRGVNDKIQSLFKEIQEKKENHAKEIEKLQAMFLFHPETLDEIDLNLQDDSESILTKIYTVEAKNAAKRDAEIMNQIEQLEDMNPATKEYEENLEKAITELVKQIPIQNRTALTHYVARRKLVLELFDKILANKLKVQSSDERQKAEALLHNLIFQQTTVNPQKSDLWLINEDFVYYNGLSEKQFREMTVDGDKLFKENDELSAEEQKIRLALGEDRFQKRPDILLFPEEGKCVIIEFKSVDTNVADHLTQINNYAGLIRNFTKDKFQFNSFYGYLIGEGIEAFDVRTHDSDFIESAHFNYLYRPAKKVAGLLKGRDDGSLYTEVLKYSTLLARAQKRNEIFIEKLFQPIPELEKPKPAPIKKGRQKKTV